MERFAAEVSQCQAQGKSKEYAFTLVSILFIFILLLFSLYWVLAYNKSMFPPRQNYQLAEDLGRAFSDRAVLHTFLDAEAFVTSGPLKVLTNVFQIIFIVVRHNYLTKEGVGAVDKVMKCLTARKESECSTFMRNENVK